MKRTGPTNPNLVQLIRNLKKLSVEKKVNIWKRVANDLEKSTRQRRKVNLYKIEKHIKPGETAIVPGKLLSLGNITKKIEIAAYQASEQTKEKLSKTNAILLTIPELMKKNPEGKKIRIIG